MTLSTGDRTPSTAAEEDYKGPDRSPQSGEITRNARRASRFLKAFAHETRLLLLCLLAERERSVTELEILLSLRQPAVSQQLARLRLDGLVATRREGKTIYYRIGGDDVRRIIAVLHEVFCREENQR